MTSSPSATLEPTPTGFDLVLVRTLEQPIEQVWRGVTESDRTAAWFGPWRGEARPGSTVELQMLFEEGEPWTEVQIVSCDAPNSYAVETSDEVGGWSLELQLTEAEGGGTLVRFTHHLTSTDGIGEIGPGWEYYLDLLASSFTGQPQPAFADYYPVMKADFEALAD